MTRPTLVECAIRAGCKTINEIPIWSKRVNEILDTYENDGAVHELSEVNLDLAYFWFDVIGDRVALAYAFSTPSLTKRDSSRIRGFPNVNESVKKRLGEKSFAADKGHLVGHASGGPLDINLFPQRRELNRGWSEEGKRYRTMERFVAGEIGTLFYSRPIYDDDSWIPDKLEYGILKPKGEWWIDCFQNK